MVSVDVKHHALYLLTYLDRTRGVLPPTLSLQQIVFTVYLDAVRGVCAIQVERDVPSFDDVGPSWPVAFTQT